MTEAPTRWKLTVEYDGAGFVGWQRQDNGLSSVQGALESAIQAFCGENAIVHAAGRTDAGVHAEGQVVHVDILKPADAKTVRDAINFHLKPHAVAVVRAEIAPPDFHARFSAVRRVYRYRIVSGRGARLVMDQGRAWHVWRALDLEAMRAGAAHLIGTHDFTTFRASECQAKSPLRSLDRLDILDIGPAPGGEGRSLEIWAEARSFLHHQVRNMVGTLKLVGEGRWTPDRVKTALDARDRRAGGPSAPPEGLCFMRVDYPVV